ncbi:MAG TPA: TetR/AcrR family transcriptional regulator [Candidatus Methylomirabilis sp.]|nr:TetR/AcrR family transcriptional regulator [Candidatus Methylomirabilis sp.]
MSPAPPKPPLRVVVRHPQRTRERILAAALSEFSTRGLAGARVDRIARRARVNKRMLYHYFGNKDDLFREIMRRKLEERAAWAAGAPDDPGETLTHWFRLACEDRDWVRLVEWEALSVGDGPVLSETERRRAFDSGVAKLRDVQAKGLLPRRLDPRHLLLSMMALTAFPLAFPQITRLVTGLSPNDRVFQKRRIEFLRSFAARLRPERESGREPGEVRPGSR